MIWGEVINAVRSLNQELLKQYFLNESYLTSECFSADVTFTQLPFHFPRITGESFDWNEVPVPEALELHPVERVLIEGPLLPVQEIEFKNDFEYFIVTKQILALEKEWLNSIHKNKPEVIQFLESTWQQISNQTRNKG